MKCHFITNNQKCIYSVYSCQSEETAYIFSIDFFSCDFFMFMFLGEMLTTANYQHKMLSLDISYYFINITFCGKILIHLSFSERSQNLIDLVSLNLSQVMTIPELNEYCKPGSLRMF